MIWQFKSERFSEESVTSGLVEIDGSDTERSLSVSEICKANRREPEAFRTWKPEKARVALVFDFSADMYSEMEDAENLESVGTVCYRYKESLKGWFSLLWRQGIAVDLVPVEKLEKISGYLLVVLPYMHLVGLEQAVILTDFVNNGGALVADPGLAFRDTRAWVQPTRPGQGLDKLFGCRELKLKAQLKPVNVSAFGLNLEAHKMLARLEPCGNGSFHGAGSSLVVNEIGKGRTYYFGFYPGVSFRESSDPQVLEMVRRLLAEAGIESGWNRKAPLVRVRRGTVGSSVPAAWVLNYEPDSQALQAGFLPDGNYRCAITGEKLDSRKKASIPGGR